MLRRRREARNPAFTFWGKVGARKSPLVAVVSPRAESTATLVQALPRGPLALGSFRVIDGVLFGSEITEDLDIVVSRTPIGEAPTIVEDSGGLPLVIGEAFAYYGSLSGGITKTSPSFANRTPIPGTAGRAIYSLAVGPDDLWYSERSCIYRTAK